MVKKIVMKSSNRNLDKNLVTIQVYLEKDGIFSEYFLTKALKKGLPACRKHTENTILNIHLNSYKIYKNRELNILILFDWLNIFELVKIGINNISPPLILFPADLLPVLYQNR